jgi:hypothetical protein
MSAMREKSSAMSEEEERRGGADWEGPLLRMSDSDWMGH